MDCHFTEYQLKISFDSLRFMIIVKKPKTCYIKSTCCRMKLPMLRLEIDALKNQHQEKEENYFEDIEILKVKNDDL